MADIVKSDEPEAVKVRLLRETIERVKSDPNRASTRLWATSMCWNVPRGYSVPRRMTARSS